MAVTSAGELFGYDAPGAGETVEVPIVLTDATGAVVTGVTFDAAGMTVWYSKPGDTNYTAFPTFGTENWRELLLGLAGAASGEYRLILRQSDAAELALLDTPGMMTFYVICTATAGDRAIIKVNAADVARADMQATIAADVAGLDGDAMYSAVMRGTDGAYTGTPPTPQTIASQVRTELTTELARVDGAVTSREAAGAAATAVGTLHDFDPTSEEVTVASASKTGYALSVAGVAAVWAHASALAIKVVTDKLAAMLEAAGAAWRWTTAALVNAPGDGAGDFSIPLTVEDDSGDPVASARLTIPGLSAQTTGAGGTFDAEWPLNAGTYEVTILKGAGYTPTNPYTLIVAADGSVTTPAGGAFVVPKLALPGPAPADYCAVRCLAETQAGEVPTGTFAVDAVISPQERETGDTHKTVLYGADSATLDGNGVASLTLLQGAVVSLSLTTPDKTREWSQVTIPALSNVDVEDLVSLV